MFFLKEHPIYVYDDRTGRAGQKLPCKLPGWIVAKTISMLRQREGLPVDTGFDDNNWSSSGRASKSRSIQSNWSPGSDLSSESPSTMDKRKSVAFNLSLSQNPVESKLAELQESIDELKSLLVANSKK